MTEKHAGPGGTEEAMSDLELVTSFLNKQLDPERVAQVRQRLEDDAEFRDLAAPLLLAWSIPRHIDRHPRPAGELEKHWDEFTRRAGFVHQRRKARRRKLWILAIAVLAVGLSAFTMRGRIGAAYADWRHYESVRADTGWVTLRDGSQALLSSGASLRASLRPVEGVQHVKLEGTARFKVVPRDSGNVAPGIQPLAIDTRAGTAFSGRGEFTVTALGDTTEVEVHRPADADRRFFGFVPVPTSVLVRTSLDHQPITIREGQRARIVKGRIPELLPLPIAP